MQIVHTRHLSKNEFVVRPGQICQFQSYVQSGSLRSYFIDINGDEHTISLAIEDWFISDFNSYINQKPSTLHVEALEDSTIQQIGYDEVENLCAINPKFEHFFRLVAQKAFAFAQKRILDNLELNAEKRFIAFNNLYPSIVERVPQYTLASYLGMKPESLSRIRKKLAAS
jgi:CRP-like cAMP-binding protein